MHSEMRKASTIKSEDEPVPLPAQLWPRAIAVGVTVAVVSGIALWLTGNGWGNRFYLPTWLGLLLWVLAIPDWVPGLAIYLGTALLLNILTSPLPGSSAQVRLDAIAIWTAFVADCVIYSFVAYYFLRRRRSGRRCANGVDIAL
jgi:hypothetical protein